MHLNVSTMRKLYQPYIKRNFEQYIPTKNKIKGGPGKLNEHTSTLSLHIRSMGTRKQKLKVNAISLHGQPSTIRPSNIFPKPRGLLKIKSLFKRTPERILRVLVCAINAYPSLAQITLGPEYVDSSLGLCLHKQISITRQFQYISIWSRISPCAKKYWARVMFFIICLLIVYSFVAVNQ